MQNRRPRQSTADHKKGAIAAAFLRSLLCCFAKKKSVSRKKKSADPLATERIGRRSVATFADESSPNWSPAASPLFLGRGKKEESRWCDLSSFAGASSPRFFEKRKKESRGAAEGRVRSQQVDDHSHPVASSLEESPPPSPSSSGEISSLHRAPISVQRRRAL
ncbi:unnamed protein product [Musa banksii]